MKKYILFITIYGIVLFSFCTREPNPFSAVTSNPEVIMDIYPTSYWKDLSTGVVTLGFFMFDPDYNSNYFDHILVFAKWDSFPQNVNDGNKIEDISYLWQGNEIKGMYIYEYELDLPFSITGSNITPPNVVSVVGPYGETFSGGRLPDIRIVVQDTNYSEGLFMERFYSIYFVDIYGNISDVYNRSIKYVDCTIYFINTDNYWENLILFSAEVTGIINSNTFEIKPAFDPSLYLSGAYNGEWMLGDILVADNSDNSGTSTNFRGNIRFRITE